MAKIRNVDLSSLTSQFTDFTKILGAEEIKILTDADLLLSGSIPHDEAGRLAYLSRSSQIQSKLNNLLSRLSYVFKMQTIDKDSYLGDLIESKEIEGRDRRYIALARDSKFRDLEETNSALEVVYNHINNILWVLKIIAGRL
jgi:hypothetical protein